MFSCWAEIITNFLFTQQVIRPEGSCTSENCQYTAGVYAWRTDYQAPPCNDFFDHICGSYYSGGSIPSPYANTLSDRNQEIDKKILNFLTESNGPAESDPAFTHVSTFYKACMDMTTIQSLSFRLIGNELSFLGLSLEWPFLDETLSDELFATKILARLHATSVGVTGFLFKMSIQLEDLDADYRRIIKIEEASDTVLKSFEDYDFLRVSMRYYLVTVIEKFHEYLGMVLTDDETEIFQDLALYVSEFLFELKKINETPLEMGIIQIQRMNVKSFQDLIDSELAGGQIQLNWKKFLTLLYGLYEQSVESIVESEEEIIILHDVERFKNILKLLRATPHEVFVSAMWWIAIDTLLYQSAHPFHQYHTIYEMYYPMFLSIDRKRKCSNWIRRHFPLFVAHVLANEEDSSSIKNEVEEMVTNIKISFSNNLRKIRWLTWKNQSLALKKLRNMNIIVGYTDSILKPSSLEKAYGTTRVEYTHFLPILCELFRKERKKNLLSLVSADSPIDDVLNYGAVGVHIARGIASAFDYLWTNPSAKDLVRCFKTVYDTLSLRKIKSCVNGELTLFSNIADAIGFKISMDAYKIRAKEKGYEQTLPVYKKKEWNDKQLPDEKKNDELITDEEQDEQLFIRAFGNTLCETGTQAYYRKKSESDETPPNRARVNGVLMNTSIFARKWKCKNHNWMNPQQKCKIWN